MKLEDSLRRDCAHCEALCCSSGVSRHRVDGFNTSSNEGVSAVCPNLELSCLETGCRVHAMLERMGEVGCVRFECYGAGQLTTKAFKNLGISWINASLNEKEMLFSFFYVARFVAEILAKAPDRKLAEALKPDIDLALSRLFCFQMLSSIGDKDRLFERFILDCESFVVLYEQVKAASAEKLVAAE